MRIQIFCLILSFSYIFKLNINGIPTSQPTSDPTNSPSLQPTIFIGGPLASIKEGLVACYLFNENPNDESGNGNDGVLYGSVTPVADRFGNPRAAYSFDGSTGYIHVPGSQFNFEVNMSISIWVNPRKVQTPYVRLLDKGTYNRNNLTYPNPGGWVIYQEGINLNSFHYEYYPSFHSFAGVGNDLPLNPSVWQHYVIAKEGNKIINYYNGDAHVTSNLSPWTIMSTGQQPLMIAACNFGYTYPVAPFVGCFFNGSLDDIFIWNRTITASEVKALFGFNSPTSQPTAIPSKLPTSRPSDKPTRKPSVQPSSFIGGFSSSLKEGLVAFFPFDGNTNDNSGNGNNGIPHGGVSLVADRFGNQRSAVSLDGATGYIEIPGEQFNFHVNMSLSMWVNPSIVTQNWSRLVDKSTYSSVNDGGWRIMRVGGGVNYVFNYVISAENTPGMSFALKPDTWNHIIVVKFPQSMTTYLNGEIALSVDTPINHMESNGNLPVLLGGSNSCLTVPASCVVSTLLGEIDDICIYNRSLTIKEVGLLYGFNSPTSQPSNRPSSQPSSRPSKRPSCRPSSQPSCEPSSWPSDKPSCCPSCRPSSDPSTQPSTQPSNRPSSQPSSRPSQRPSCRPNSQPSCEPSSWPSDKPSCCPSCRPSSDPSTQPSTQPSNRPSSQPSSRPSQRPSCRPNSQPSCEPSSWPSDKPSCCPSCRPSSDPSTQPSTQPSNRPSSQPSSRPSKRPSCRPSSQPSCEPSSWPSDKPSCCPSCRPSSDPSTQPSTQPSNRPSSQPSSRPSQRPSCRPNSQPSREPSSWPSDKPSCCPSCRPSSDPSTQPSTQPSNRPSSQPSSRPSKRPSCRPSSQPSCEPSSWPSDKPSCCPSCRPSSDPSTQPSTQPSNRPSSQPSSRPSQRPSCRPNSQPSREPSSWPSDKPSCCPSCRPSSDPSTQPSTQPSNRPSSQPSGRPSKRPSCKPSSQPSCKPSSWPSDKPSCPPTCRPSSDPSTQPSNQPSTEPSSRPSTQPTRDPSSFPSPRPSVKPSVTPSSQPSVIPSASPSRFPLSRPTFKPSSQPSSQPTNNPFATPSSAPSFKPSIKPTTIPSNQPSANPTNPSSLPTSQPSPRYSRKPSFINTFKPTVFPTLIPSLVPTQTPTFIPTPIPSAAPTIFLMTATSNDSNWKGLLSLIGVYASDQQTFNRLNVFPPTSGRSIIVFGEAASSSFRLINAFPSFSDHYPIGFISLSYKRDTTSRTSLVPGDVNQDGYNDLIVCNPLSSRCFIFFGNNEGLTNVMTGVTLFGQSDIDYFGFAVASVGDMNGDGKNDLLISALNGGACYIIYGRLSWPRKLKIQSLVWGENRKDSDGERIIADSSIALMGISVAGLGDVNGDGYVDVAISVITTSSTNSNIVYVIYGTGGSGTGEIELGQVENGLNGFRISGVQGYYTGFSISGIGDFNGDGYNDIIIGAFPYSDSQQSQLSFVVFGNSQRGDLNLASLLLGQGVKISGGGFIVSGVGDINQDGLDDVMVTICTDYVGQINSYIVVYPTSITSSPSLVPSSPPSSRPTDSPSSRPSTHSPSHLFDKLTLHPSLNITNSSLTIAPTTKKSRAPSKLRTEQPSLLTASPTLSPTAASTSHSPTPFPSKAPVRRPSRTPTRIPTIFSLTASPTGAQTINVANISAPVKVTGNVDYSKETIFLSLQITGTGNIQIKGSSGGNIYNFIPPTATTSSTSALSSNSRSSSAKETAYNNIDATSDSNMIQTTITILNFDLIKDILDLSSIPTIWSVTDISYSDNPVTIAISANYKIILSSLQTLKLSNVRFKFLPYPSNTSQSQGALFKDPSVYVPLAILLICVVLLAAGCHQYGDNEKENLQRNGIMNFANLAPNFTSEMNVNDYQFMRQKPHEAFISNTEPPAFPLEHIREEDSELFNLTISDESEFSRSLQNLSKEVHSSTFSSFLSSNMKSSLESEDLLGTDAHIIDIDDNDISLSSEEI